MLASQKTRGANLQELAGKMGKWVSKRVMSAQNGDAWPREIIKVADKNEHVRGAVEVLLEAKVNLFRAAVKRFRSDMMAMVVYMCFTALFTFTLLGRESIKDSFIVRNAVVNTLVNVGGYPVPLNQGLDAVGGLDDIYQYLKLVVIPNVALANMTALDPMCDELGRDLILACDPLVPGACCGAVQPNPSCFVTGGNMMVTPVTVRQLRAGLQSQTEIYTGDFVQSYPMPWSDGVNEGKNGAGTTKQWDTKGLLIDWPADPYSTYYTCSPTLADSCAVSAARATYPDSYSRNGFVATLKGFDVDMLASVDALKKVSFLDQRATRAVFVDFTAYLPNRKLFVIVSILFEIIDLGQVTASYTIFVTDLGQATSIVWIILEYSVFGCAAIFPPITYHAHAPLIAIAPRRA